MGNRLSESGSLGECRDSTSAAGILNSNPSSIDNGRTINGLGLGNSHHSILRRRASASSKRNMPALQLATETALRPASQWRVEIPVWSAARIASRL